MKSIYSKEIIKRAEEIVKQEKTQTVKNNQFTVYYIENLRHIPDLVKYRDLVSDKHRQLIIKLHKEFKPEVKSFLKNQLLSEIKHFKNLLITVENKINNRAKDTADMMLSYSSTLNLKELIIDELQKKAYEYKLTFYKVNLVKEILSSIYLPNLNLTKSIPIIKYYK